MAVDWDLPVANIITKDEILDRASVGICGVLPYLVAQRTQEIGTRMSPGGRPEDVLLTVAWQGVALSDIRIVVGAAGALAVTFGMAATAPTIFLTVAGLVADLPSRRATKLDPVQACGEGS